MRAQPYKISHDDASSFAISFASQHYLPSDTLLSALDKAPSKPVYANALRYTAQIIAKALYHTLHQREIYCDWDIFKTQLDEMLTDMLSTNPFAKRTAISGKIEEMVDTLTNHYLKEALELQEFIQIEQRIQAGVLQPEVLQQKCLEEQRMQAEVLQQKRLEEQQRLQTQQQKRRLPPSQYSYAEPGRRRGKAPTQILYDDNGRLITTPADENTDPNLQQQTHRQRTGGRTCRDALKKTPYGSNATTYGRDTTCW